MSNQTAFLFFVINIFYLFSHNIITYTAFLLIHKYEEIKLEIKNWQIN